jgi:peptidoglycan/LPS O-acetylase OafA/YrhL
VPAGTGRLPAIDWIKAVAIVAVVLTHAGPTPWQPGFTPTDSLLRLDLTLFHVPSFLLIAGFLYQRPEPLSGRDLRGRLLRILIPYAIASAVAQATGLSGARNAHEVMVQLVTASSLGIYYFVRELALCIVLAWPLSRLSLRAQQALLAALLAAAIGFEYWLTKLWPYAELPWIGTVNLAMVADQLYAFVYFLIGWVAAASGARLPARSSWQAWAMLAFGIAGIATITALSPFAESLQRFWIGGRVPYTLAVIALLLVLTGRASIPSPVRFLSEASLGIYLYHFYFQSLLAPHVVAWPPALRIPVSLAIDVGCAAALCWLARRLLGASRARTLVGA